VAGVKDLELKARAVAEGFHFSAEGPGEATTGPRAGLCDEGRWPEGGAEGPVWGFEATRGGTGSTQSAEGFGTIFFVVGPQTRFHTRCLPNTTRASPICLLVPRIETWRLSHGPDFNM